MVHIGADKDFTPVIEKALELGGYKEDTEFTGINGGKEVMTGFAHNAVLENAGKIVDLVKQGKIRHFFLIGGCDGAAPGRSYYTEFAKKTPMDTIILTLACGKYRLNDLRLGEIELGILETYDAASIIEAADQAAKTAIVDVIELRIAKGMCGKSYMLLTGEVSAVEASIEKAKEFVAEKGMYLDSSVIAHPDKRMMDSLL